MAVEISMKNEITPTYVQGDIYQVLDIFNTASANGRAFVAINEVGSDEPSGFHMSNVNRLRPVKDDDAFVA